MGFENFLTILWKCLRCGYQVVAENPPEQCPDCGAPREEFVHVEED